MFTAGLLRQFHDRTPHSPYVPPIVGSLLFAAVFLLLLVAAREYRIGAAPGKGIRMGSLTPIMLMLLVEKWVSLGLYSPVFFFLAPRGTPAPMADAQYRAFAGAGLLLVCLLASTFSPPAARRTWRRLRPGRWLPGIGGAGLAVGASYAILAGLSAALGGGFRLRWPAATPLLAWAAGGQTLLALGEEIYYRGLLLFEMQRLAPRLGARSPAARRWCALVPTALLFGMEHVTLGPPWNVATREMVFALALGLLFGMLVLATANLPFAAAIHAFINWLVLGAAPRFDDLSGQTALPAGTYVGLVLALAFVLAFAFRPKEGEARA